MFDQLKSYALGSHGWFYPEGAAFTSPVPGGTVDVSHLPDAADAGWQNRFIGDTEDWSDKKKIETEETQRPKPGILVRKDIVTFFQSLDMEMTTNSLMRIAMQIMYGSAVDLTTLVGQFVPMSQPPPNGWLKLQRYTNDNQLVFAADLWVRMDVQEVSSGNKKIVKPKFMASLLDSDLNTMFFGDPSLLGP